jgi:hypothetical protein
VRRWELKNFRRHQWNQCAKIHLIITNFVPRAAWQIQSTVMHRHGRVALPRRLLADQQASPAKLAFVPMLN